MIILLLQFYLNFRISGVADEQSNMRKLILLGGDSVGKTVLCKRIMGKPFTNQEAAVGFTPSPCNVWRVTAENGKWTEYETPKMELYTGIYDNELKLSLLDFGGQSLFRELHHLLVTSYGVYIVVFNMLDMLDNSMKERSLTELCLWINTIVFHTYNVETRKTAPVFLVGTHKDKVSDQSRHQYISDVIEEKFKYSMVWASIVEYNGLCFFPVNNHQGRPHNYIAQWFGRLFYTANELDDGLGNLRSEIERVIKDSECMKEPKPLAWFRAIDELTASTKSFLTLKEASKIATAHGIKECDVPVFLSFLNKMGEVLWLDEEGLRDVVILDVMTFFIEPASLIVCSHISNFSDSTNHLKKIQLACSREFPLQWTEMNSGGMVDRGLVDILLGKLVLVDNIPVVISMMLKYGLIVKDEVKRAKTMESEQSIVPMVSEVYMVPSLLPRTVVDPCVFEDEIWKTNVKQWKSCYFVFGSPRDKYFPACFCFSHLKHDCFLPRELMGRLMGKVVKWTSETDGTSVLERPCLYQDYAVFLLKQQHFRLVCIPELNCIRLDIEGEYVLPVYNRICELINICVKECMGSLEFLTGLPLFASLKSIDDPVLLNINYARSIQLGRRSLMVNGYPDVDRQFIVDNYSEWLFNTNLLPSDDVFISPRRNENDDKVSSELHEAFRDLNVGFEKRNAHAFLDTQSQSEFGEALFNAVVPTAASQMMKTHSPPEEDNVLIEWMLALGCMKAPIHSKMQRGKTQLEQLICILDEAGVYPLQINDRISDQIYKYVKRKKCRSVHRERFGVSLYYNLIINNHFEQTQGGKRSGKPEPVRGLIELSSSAVV